MTMTASEIARDYAAAKNKREQLRILADLNTTTEEEICKILAGEGMEVKAKRCGRATKTKTSAADGGIASQTPAEGATPCYHCDRRAVGCHVSCREYLDWCAAREREKASRQQKGAAFENAENITRETKPAAETAKMSAAVLMEVMKGIGEVFPEASVRGFGSGAVGGVRLTVVWDAAGELAGARVELMA